MKARIQKSPCTASGHCPVLIRLAEHPANFAFQLQRVCHASCGILVHLVIIRRGLLGAEQGVRLWSD